MKVCPRVELSQLMYLCDGRSHFRPVSRAPWMRGVSEGMFLCGVLTNNEAELCQVQLLSMLQLTMDTEEPLLTQNIDQQYIDDDMIRVVIVCRCVPVVVFSP